MSVTSRPFINPYYPEADVLYTLVFKGLTIDLYEIMHERGVAVLRVELTDNRWRFPSKLRIGRTRQEVLQSLGKPTEDLNSEWRYVCADCVLENKITFRFSSNKVSMIKWDFDLD